MKKRIEGKTYNTDTATHLACCTNAEGHEETIYQQKDGTYFMHVKNAENTIRPLTHQKAWDWAEIHLTPEACRDAFGFVRTNSEEGVCPLCGSSDLNYPCGGEINDVGVNYDWECKNCGASGTEGFSRVFDEHLYVYDEEGNEITILPPKEAVPAVEAPEMTYDRAIAAVKKLIKTLWDCGQEDCREDYCIACDIVDLAEVTPDELIALGFEEIAKAYATPTEPKAYRIG